MWLCDQTIKQKTNRTVVHLLKGAKGHPVSKIHTGFAAMKTCYADI